MNRYYKLEDIKNALIELARSDKWLGRETTTNIIEALLSLPAIEADEDCISREQIIEAHYEWCNQHHGETDVFYTWSLRLMRDAPSVVPSRAEGEWVHLAGNSYRCSNCDEYTKSEKPFHKPKGNYCLKCGAKMKGVEE